MSPLSITKDSNVARSILGSIIRIAAIIVIVIAPDVEMLAQPAPAPADTVRATHWYDTLTVTRPRYAGRTRLDKLALSTFAGVSLPAIITAGALTLFPVSLNFLSEGGDLRPGFAISSGVGFGGDNTELLFFSDVRAQLEVGWYPNRDHPVIARIGALHDMPLISIHKRNFFYLSTAAGAGLSTDFDHVSPYVEGFFGIANPNGIRFLGLYPGHSYGLRGRIGHDFATGKQWYEASIAITSSFWL